FGPRWLQRFVQAGKPAGAERSEVPYQCVQRGGEYARTVDGPIGGHRAERFEPRVLFLDVLVIRGEAELARALAGEQSPQLVVEQSAIPLEKLAGRKAAVRRRDHAENVEVGGRLGNQSIANQRTHDRLVPKVSLEFEPGPFG